MRVLGWVAVVVAVLIVQLAVWALAPVLPLGPVAGFGVAWTMVVGAVLLVGATAPGASLRGVVALLAPVGVIAVVGLWSSHGMIAAVAVAGALLAGGSLAGGIVGAGVKHPGHLLVVAWVSTLADLYSVLSPHGVSAQVVKSQAALSLVAVSWPIPGTSQVSPVLGVGDVMVTTVYLVAARVHRIGVGRMILALAVGYAATFGALLTLRRTLPALPFLAGGVVLIVPAARRLAPADRRTAWTGMGLFTLLFALAWWVR